ncbi:MAG TPA: hypothetical protein VHR15_01610 [Ktedonobacterales bacterium]|jgi:hypothetical protein|nr:hypothetical protein [Ktedonobacterales bacterium]
MKVRHSALQCVMLMLALGSMLAVTACGSGTGTTGGSTGNGTPTVAATATAKPKPTNVPHLDLAYCQQLMSLDEMNTLFKPPAPATTIVPTNGDTGGACNYEVAKANIPLIIYFLEWKGPDPIPQSDIDAELAKAIGTEITITVATPVTGIGHQAEYVEATGAGGSVHVFYVLEGPFIFDCVTYGFLAAGFLGTQDQLQQCATQVDSRL